mgnify:CR=1 FL=1
MNITERFLKYVGYGTNSDEKSETCPSTPNQLVLGAAIAEELKALGLTDVEQDADGYVYGYLPGEGEALGLIAHMDTSPAVSGDHIKPRIVTYPGGVLELGASTLSPTDYPFLEEYIGQELIVTDGTTLLGADDKAGVAEIVTLCEYLLAHPEVKHRPIAVCFTPDEEIGRGPLKFDVAGFGAKLAYTLDGGAAGSIEYENFNADQAEVTVKGYSIHPGSAKDKMRNSQTIAMEFDRLLPAAERPQYTEGYEGFYHMTDIHGGVEETHCTYILRDHDSDKLAARGETMQKAAAFLNERYGEGTVTVEITHTYRNMKEKILPVYEVITVAEEAIRTAGLTPVTVPIRGGTDGATLSYMGLPCPNLGTGGCNAHGRYECNTKENMEQCVQIVLEIVKGYAAL